MILYRHVLDVTLVEQTEVVQLVKLTSLDFFLCNFYCRAKKFSSCIQQLRSTLNNHVDITDILVVLGDFNAIESYRDTNSNNIRYNDQRFINFKLVQDSVLEPFCLTDTAMFPNNLSNTHFCTRT